MGYGLRDCDHLLLARRLRQRVSLAGDRLNANTPSASLSCASIRIWKRCAPIRVSADLLSGPIEPFPNNDEYTASR